MSYDDAIQSGAVAIFEEKYGDRVRVMRFGDFSTELCGGTHAGATGDIGLLKVVSETGIAAGVRRIEALTGMGALAHVRGQEARLREIAALLKAPESDIVERVERLLDERKAAQREIDSLRGAQRGDLAGDLVDAARTNADGKVLAARVDGVEAKELRTLVDDLRGKLGEGIVLIASETGGKVLIAVGVTKALTDRWKAGDLVREAAKIVGGGGGGRPDFAQAGGKDASKIEDAIADFYERLDAQA